ncbi:MAG: hypothetical protein C4331_15555 [Meiothermus sp.]
MTGLPELALAFLGIVAGGALWLGSRREQLWRWAALGTLAWGLQTAFWLTEHSLGWKAPVSPSDSLLMLGAAGWLMTLRGLGQRELPRLTLSLLPTLGVAVFGLLSQPNIPLHQIIALLDVAPVLFALPPLEAALRSRASEARLVWGLGLLFKAVGTLALFWLGGPPGWFVYFAWGLGYVLLLWGGRLELHHQQIPKPLLGLLIASAVLSLVLLAVDLSESRHPYLVLSLAVWAYTVLVALGGVGFVVSQRIISAERRLELWINLLQSLSTDSAATQSLSPHGVMQSVLDGLKPLFDNLVGLEVRTDITQRVGQTAPYVRSFELALETPTEGRLYFSGPPGDERGLEALAPLLTERLRLSLTLNEWRSKAYTDPLTGLLNRRGYERQMGRLIRLSQESGKPITLALLDLDHFKRVNDTFGHAAGDEVLKALATLLRKLSRTDDLAVRLGGEEFCLVLFGASLEDAGRMLERVRAEFKELKIPSVSWKLTLSGGIAGGEIPTSMATAGRWLEQADGALYDAKQGGRDRVYSAAPHMLKPFK